ncbi:MAG: SMI1/KNR4 family protein [Planctomycetota bacterium]
MLKPPPESCIRAAEVRLGIEFPPTYRARLLSENGGSVEIGDTWWDLYPVADDSEPNRIGPTWDHVCRQTELARLLGGFPVTAIAIGEDGSGDRLVMLRRRDDGPFELAVWKVDTGDLQWTVDAVDAVFAG